MHMALATKQYTYILLTENLNKNGNINVFYNEASLVLAIKSLCN